MWVGRLNLVICVIWPIEFSYVCGLAGCIQLFVWFGRLRSVICVVWQAASTRCVSPCPSYFWSILTPVTFLSVFFLPSGNPPKAFIIGFFDVCQQTDRPIGFLDVCRQTDRPTGFFDVYRQTDGPIGFSDARVRYSLCVDRLTIIRNDATNLINIFEKEDNSLSDVSNISLFVKIVNRLSLVKI